MAIGRLVLGLDEDDRHEGLCWTPKHVSKAFRDGTRDSGSTYNKELPRGLFAGIIRDTWGFYFQLYYSPTLFWQIQKSA
uniref:Uncharacterized protein n=1 Tax=Zea mays TaxID=4577 RepID=A0A804R3D1_MAIZE